MRTHRTVDVVEDCEWMDRHGEKFTRAAERLGYSTATLERTLERAGRYDLVTSMRSREDLRWAA